MENKQKKKWKKPLILGVTALLVAALALLPMLAAARDGGDDQQASILTATAARLDIDTQLIGGGQLESGASVGVKIPENVKLTGYLVGNGDLVTKGDAVATVDRVSVMTAITQVQETLDYLSEQISGVSGDEAADTVTALAGGTVKQLYAQTGQAVQDVMLEHGALAVLSLDGLMAVQIECDTGADAGDKVLITFPDGGQAEARVKTKLEGVLTITLTDDGYTPGDAVTVSAQDGTALGQGTLYILSPWNATAYAGVVSGVQVREGDTVYAGQTLYRLEDTGHTAQYQQLIDQRQEYEALMEQLFQLYREQVVTAPCDGIVTGVDANGTFLLGSDSGVESGAASLDMSGFGGAAQTLNRAAGSVRLMTLETGPAPGTDAVSILTQSLPAGVVGQSYTATMQATSGSGPVTGVWSAAGLPAGLTMDAAGAISGTPTAAGSYTVTVGFTGDDGGTATRDYALTVSDTPSVSYLGYVAQVREVAGSTLRVMQSAYSYPITDVNVLPQATVDAAALTEEKTYDSALVGEGAVAAGDYVFLVVDADGATLLRIAALTVTPGDGPNTPGISTPSGGGMSGGGQTASFTPYSLDTVTVASVTSQENMSVSITVDELDITSLRVGQAAVVTVDALGGRQFDAAVSEIGGSGENTGGNSKFTVVLTLEKSSEMLPGMVSSAFNTLDAARDALCIPVAALARDGATTVVYTDYDARNRRLTGPVAVTLGASDGENVEILSGLTEGQQVCYAYYDTLVETEAAQQTRGLDLRQLLRG